MIALLSVIVVAAGRGTRMGAEKNKLLLPLAGEPLLCRTLQRLQTCAEIDEIVLVAREEEILLWHALRLKERFPLLTRIVPGGETRSASVTAGIAAADAKATWLAVHDGARPLTPREDLERLFACRTHAQAALLATPVKETVKRAESFVVRETVPRHDLWLAQTPQLFKREVLCAAYAALCVQGAEFTDDAGAVEAYGVTVEIVPGSSYNIKVTTPEDLLLAEAIWRWQEDAHRHRL